jgi:hypothetical protein
MERVEASRPRSTSAQPTATIACDSEVVGADHVRQLVGPRVDDVPGTEVARPR